MVPLLSKGRRGVTRQVAMGGDEFTRELETTDPFG
jgi:hypothetical protein